jgi:hypothetical protein
METAQYLDNARECRRLAAMMPLAEQREAMQRIADQWEMLATQHEVLARRRAPLRVQKSPGA